MNKLIEKLETDFPLNEKTDFQLIDVKNTEYGSALLQLIPLLQKNNTRICIVSTSRDAVKLLEELGKKTDIKNIFVLSGIKNDVSSQNIKYYEPQWKIDSLKESISFAVKNFGPELFVFDSITNLSLFLSKQEISEFIGKFVGILKSKQIKGIFLNVSNETPDDIAVLIEGSMDQKILLEKFLGRKTAAEIKTKVLAPVLSQPKIKPPTQKQQLDVKDLKKSLAQLVREEARKIAEETRRNLETKETETTEKKKTEKKKQVFKLEKEKEKQKLQKKLELLEKSLELGVISQKAFDEGKSQIMSKLKKK